MPISRQLVVLLAFALLPATATAQAAFDALRRDGAVALLRHADAPGIGDPAGWKLGDCPSQRNLDDAGRAQARALGQRLRAARIAFLQVLASPWCRTVETATLLGAGPVRTEATLSNAYMLSERRPEFTAGARAPISAWRGPGALLLVTHGENIQALVGRSPATAELVVVSARQDGSVREVAATTTPPR